MWIRPGYIEEKNTLRGFCNDTGFFFLDHNIKCDVFETYPYKLLPVNHGSQQSAGFTAAGVSTCCYKDVIREYSWQHLANSHLRVYAKQTNSSQCSVSNVSSQNCQLSVPIFCGWSHFGATVGAVRYGLHISQWLIINPHFRRYLFQVFFVAFSFIALFFF